MTAPCIECEQPTDHWRPVEWVYRCDRRGHHDCFCCDDSEPKGLYLCWRCIHDLCDGCIPEWTSRGDGSPVYWWHCAVCERAVRRGRYKVPPELRGPAHELHALALAGIADAGTMLCRECVMSAAVAEIPAEILRFRPRTDRGQEVSE